MVCPDVNPISLHQLSVIQKIHGNRQLLVGGDTVNSAVYSSAFPEFDVHHIISPGAESVQIRCKVQPVSCQGIGQIIACPCKGNVQLSIGVQERLQLCFIVVPADLVVAYRKMVPFQQQFIQRILHQLQIIVRLSYGVVNQPDRLLCLHRGLVSVLPAAASQPKHSQ